jgi:hypothetical protein
MSREISSFVRANKPWLIRKAISNYFRASNAFSNLDRERSNGHLVRFESLKNLSDILFDIKEDMYLIFRRLVNPKKRIFEDANKYTPSQFETEFINNVGLLFHKTMIVRELEYVMEHYTEEDEELKAAENDFNIHWLRMKVLFNNGIEIIKRMLEQYKDNLVVISYFLENDRYVEDVLKENIHDLLSRLYGEDNYTHAYIDVGEYCIKRGWNDKAKKILGDALSLDPENDCARQLIRTVNNEHKN